MVAWIPKKSNDSEAQTNIARRHEEVKLSQVAGRFRRTKMKVEIRSIGIHWDRLPDSPGTLSFTTYVIVNYELPKPGPHTI
jgi:hypothetical protein